MFFFAHETENEFGMQSKQTHSSRNNQDLVNIAMPKTDALVKLVEDVERRMQRSNL